jgi:hypothetical protein
MRATAPRITPPQPTTERRRACFRATQRIRATPEAIFPLLCPVREYDYLPDWECELVYTESGLAEEGCVFRTDREADGGLDTWVVSRFEPPRRIAFVRVNPLRTMQYDVTLAPEEDGTTTLVWEQVVTALDEAGDRHVAARRQEDFTAGIEAMETKIERYLHGD